MARIPTIAKPFHAATGAPAPPEWAGYWTFVTATILVAFVLFLAGKGTLSKWLGLFNLGAIKPLSLGSIMPAALTPVTTPGPGQGQLPNATNQQGIFGAGLGGLPVIGPLFQPGGVFGGAK